MTTGEGLRQASSSSSSSKSHGVQFTSSSTPVISGISTATLADWLLASSGENAAGLHPACTPADLRTKLPFELMKNPFAGSNEATASSAKMEADEGPSDAVLSRCSEEISMLSC